MSKKFLIVFLSIYFIALGGREVHAQTKTLTQTPIAIDSATATSSSMIKELPTPTEMPLPTPRPDITQKSDESAGPFETLLADQKLGEIYLNPLKYAIREATSAGVPANTIVLLLLLPVIALVIAISRQIIGIRGFGIFLPAALSVVFVALGPVTGILLFIVIVFISTILRLGLRRFKVRLQYLPRMAIMLWSVALGVLGLLFLAPLLGGRFFTNISIFPVLILILLSEDFTKVQIGKSARTALNLTMETLLLSMISYFFMTLKVLQNFALLRPEILLVSVLLLDILIGRYIGLRLREYVRFRKLIKS